MKIHRHVLFGLIAGVSAFAVSSCAYDPYYSGSSHYGGYGDGYGYGGSNFSTSFFVTTGNPRWAYDPYAGAYYDYTRRSYYDPYLYGYYPVGYRPRYVHGAPHPHGWSRGSNYCPPPSRVRSHSLRDYHDRSERYRSLGRPWSDNVRVSTQGRDHHSGYGDRDRGGSRDDRMQRSFRDDRSNRDGAVFGGDAHRPSYSGTNTNHQNAFKDRSGGSDRRGYIPQHSGVAQPDFRNRGSEARSNRNESLGRGSSPGAFVRPPHAGGNSDRSNRGVRSAPPERQAPPHIDRRGDGGRDRDDSDERRDKRAIRGLGQG